MNKHTVTSIAPVIMKNPNSGSLFLIIGKKSTDANAGYLLRDSTSTPHVIGKFSNHWQKVLVETTESITLFNDPNRTTEYPKLMKNPINGSVFLIFNKDKEGIILADTTNADRMGTRRSWGCDLFNFDKSITLFNQ